MYGLKMDCKHRAGLTYKVSRLKPRTSEKMGDLVTNNEDLFFSSPILFLRKTEHLRTCIPFFALRYTNIISENGISENVKNFFCSSNQCDHID